MLFGLKKRKVQKILTAGGHRCFWQMLVKQLITFVGDYFQLWMNTHVVPKWVLVAPTQNKLQCPFSS